LGAELDSGMPRGCWCSTKTLMSVMNGWSQALEATCQSHHGGLIHDVWTRLAPVHRLLSRTFPKSSCGEGAMQFLFCFLISQ